MNFSRFVDKRLKGSDLPTLLSVGTGRQGLTLSQPSSILQGTEFHYRKKMLTQKK
jgi:hypothetical protein